MFRHVVMFRWHDHVTEADVAATADALDSLAAAIPEIAAYRHGRDRRLAEGNFDYVVVADFASVDDYVVYRDHPQHREFITGHIVGSIAERAAIQYDLSA